MYDKSGSVLRLEMVINEPEGFTVRKQVTRKGKKVMRWVDMRKGVAYLFRYRHVSLAANSRYLAALAEVDNPTDAIRTLERVRLFLRFRVNTVLLPALRLLVILLNT